MKLTKLTLIVQDKKFKLKIKEQHSFSDLPQTI